MLIEHNPEEHKTITKNYICSYHKKYPFRQYAGCGCYTIWTMIRKSIEELRKEKRNE